MYLHRTTETAEGRGGYYPRKYDHLEKSIMAPSNRYPCRRSYTPTATSPSLSCPPLSLVDDRTATHHALSSASPSRSPPSPVTTVHPSGEVFLPNYKLSADFLQLRSDSKASPMTVRLYLTANELVKKSSFAPNGCSQNSGSVANSEAIKDGHSGREFTISRYRLQDIEVSRSKVSAETMMVAVSSSPDVNSAPAAAVRYSVGVTATPRTASLSHGTSHFPTTDSIEGGKCSSVERAPVMLVEAYQLVSVQGNSIDDWISHIDQGKRKLVILDKLQRNNSQGNHAAADLSSRGMQTQPGINNNHRPTSIAVSSKALLTGGQRKTGEVAHYKRSVSGYEVPTQNPSSPTGKKFPTTTNGRYTPLHHHYSPHRLFSNTQVRSSAHGGVQLRHTPENSKDPFKIFRRFSLGGGSGTYRFPSPPANTQTTTSPQGEDEVEMSFGGREKVGESLPGGSVVYRENHSLPSSSRNSPSSSPLRKSPMVTRRDGTLSERFPQQHDILRQKRRPTISRSVSEYHNKSGGDMERDHQTGVESIVQCDRVQQHQVSDLLPNGSSIGYNGGQVDTSRGVDGTGRGSRENSVPPELRELQSFLTSLPSPSDTSTVRPSLSPPLANSSPSPSDNEGEDKGFQSFLRHKQIRGRKIHVSPRAHSTSVSSEILSPPAWVDKFSLPPSSSSFLSPSSSRSTPSQGGSATLPRGHKLKGGTTATAKTLDREGQQCVLIMILCIFIIHSV